MKGGGAGAVQVAIKGSRAMVKVYTDLQASVADVQSWYSVGLEPIIGLVRPERHLFQAEYTYTCQQVVCCKHFVFDNFQ